MQKTSIACGRLGVVPAWLAKQHTLLLLICFSCKLRIIRSATLRNRDVGENTDRYAAGADHKK